MSKYETVFDIIKSRRSVRSFIEDYKIDDDTVMKLLEAAKFIPSARNIQPLEFIVIRDKEVLNALTKPCQQNQTSKVDATIVVIGDLFLARKVGSLSSHSNTTAEKGSSIFIHMDAAAATQNIMLAANSMDIDTLWISSFDEKEISKILDLPETYIPLVIIPLGKRKNEPFAPQKRPLNERIHHDRYKSINHDYSYLEISKSINEVDGELKNYLTISEETAIDILHTLLDSCEYIENKDDYLKYIKAVSTKAYNISKEISRRGRAMINPDEMKLVGLLSRIGLLLTDISEYEEIFASNYLVEKGYTRLANIIGSQIVGQDKIARFMKKTDIKLPFISSYGLDSLEKKILTFAILSTTKDGMDIYYIDMLNDMMNNEKNEHMLKFYEAKYEQLIRICDEVEDNVNN